MRYKTAIIKKAGLPPGNDKICKILSNGENFDPQKKKVKTFISSEKDFKKL